jgi:hypothetical protein
VGANLHLWLAHGYRSIQNARNERVVKATQTLSAGWEGFGESRTGGR